jgi:hypothetical protein
MDLAAVIPIVPVGVPAVMPPVTPRCGYRTERQQGQYRDGFHSAPFSAVLSL